MSDAVERLKWFCSPDAERLSDGERINQFVKSKPSPNLSSG
jgi:hypothetical protein